MEDNDKNLNTLRNFRHYKKGYNKKFVKAVKEKGGGSKPFGNIARLQKAAQLLLKHCQGVKLFQLKDILYSKIVFQDLIFFSFVIP